MVKWYDRIGNSIEMFVNGTWIKGTIINGKRTGDGIINMETADGEKYWCGVCSGTYYKTSDSLGDLITQADRIRAMSDEELVEVIPCPYMKDDYDECKFGWHEQTQTCEECKLEWLKSEAKE